MDIYLSIGWILILLVAIVAICALFTNGIEWVGHRHNLSEGAIGSVFAAVGTALPETLVPLIAIGSGMLAGGAVAAHQAEAIGIGAILGAPFLLSTLAMCVSGVAVFYFTSRKKREAKLRGDLHLFRRDLHYFFIAYGTVFLAAYLGNPFVKHALAIGLLVFYGIYVYRTMKREHVPDSEFHLPPLLFAPRKAEPSTGLIFFQVGASLLALMLCVHFFVDAIHHVAVTAGISPLVLSLIITPIATELPEKFNSVVWISQRKDNLALGNITGAMVFQSCIPTAIGLSFTPWILNAQGNLSVWLCFASAALMYLAAWKSPRWMAHIMLAGGLFYAIFLIDVLRTL